MRKIVSSMNISLDGFAGGPHGEIDWIKVDEELFNFLTPITEQADTALYGRNTYRMMEEYWPTAADKPAATKHDREHSRWYNNAMKIVLSKTLRPSDVRNAIIVSEDIPKKINSIKQGAGKNILMFGSPSAVQTLMQHNLIDEYWLFINPIILGSGIPTFANLKNIIRLKFREAKVFSSGVICLHYEKEPEQ